MEEAAERKLRPEPALTAKQLEQQRKLDNFQLSRSRLLHDLQTACNPRYRSQLEAALAHLDREISNLQSV
jgi:hypothetical protein